MNVTTFQTTYSLIEFHYFIDDDQVSVIELLLNTDDLDHIEKDFSSLFAVETPHQTYIFSDYSVSEYYQTENGSVKVVCIK